MATDWFQIDDGRKELKWSQNVIELIGDHLEIDVSCDGTGLDAHIVAVDKYHSAKTLLNVRSVPPAKGRLNDICNSKPFRVEGYAYIHEIYKNRLRGVG